MRSKLLPSAGLVFGSGLCALLYQTTWLREFRLIFGSTTAATAAVLAIFMGGLGAGSLLFGRRAENAERPLAFYARLELFIAASAALTSVLIPLIRIVYVSCGGTLTLGPFFGTAIRLLLATIVLGAPTLLMGGTLPAMARFAVSDEDTSRRGLALLYGMNTLGAVAGAGLGTFVLFERCGNRLTLFLACLLNASIALAALLLARNETKATRPKASRERAAEPTAPFSLVLFAAAITGFVFLLLELVWYRMLSPLLGGSTFTFGLILAAALFGIGLGGVLYSLGAGERRPTLNAFACTCALEALCVAIPFAIGDRLVLVAMLLHPLGTLGFYGRVLSWGALCGVIVFPAAVVAGVQFPILLGLLGKGRDKVGVQTGMTYGWNTAGAIVGSLAGGFWFIPTFTAPGTWKFVVITLAGCAFLATIIAQRKIANPLRSVPSLALGTLAISLIFFAVGPTAAWRHSPMGLGILQKYDATPNQLHDLINAARRDILWEADGRETSIGVSKSNSLAFMVNGKCDGNTRGDAGTQVMAGLLGALTRPNSKSAAVVGLGTGSTAGWLAAIPSIERVDVMEIEPTLAKFAAECAPVNHDALHNPKLHLLFGDARELLLTEAQKYDLIVSEPSNPYRAGIATLFTQEYYRAVASRLQTGGLFVQWLQAYDVDMGTVQIFYATLGSVFPHLETWQTEDGDLLLVGSKDPISYDIASLRERAAQEPFKSALANVWRTTDVEGIFSHYVANEKFTRIVMREREIPLNTDDRTLLEFAFARNLRMSHGISFAQLRGDAGAFGADHPAIRGEVDWKDVEVGRLGIFVPFESPPQPNDALSGTDRALGAVVENYVKGNLSRAWTFWEELHREPRTLVELTIVAECLADQGDTKAFTYINRLAEIEPTDAKAIKARLLYRQQRIEEAGVLLGKVCDAFHTDPWPLRDLMTRTMGLAWQVAQEDKSLASARLIYHAIEKPFCIYNIDESRMMTLLRVGTEVDGGRVGKFALRGIEAPEPNVPWQLNFLKVRSACYEHFHHPLADIAKAELAEFVKTDADHAETKDSEMVKLSDRVASVREY